MSFFLRITCWYLYQSILFPFPWVTASLALMNFQVGFLPPFFCSPILLISVSSSHSTLAAGSSNALMWANSSSDFLLSAAVSSFQQWMTWPLLVIRKCTSEHELRSILPPSPDTTLAEALLDCPPDLNCSATVPQNNTCLLNQTGWGNRGECHLWRLRATLWAQPSRSRASHQLRARREFGPWLERSGCRSGMGGFAEGWGDCLVTANLSERDERTNILQDERDTYTQAGQGNGEWVFECQWCRWPYVFPNPNKSSTFVVFSHSSSL